MAVMNTTTDDDAVNTSVEVSNDGNIIEPITTSNAKTTIRVGSYRRINISIDETTVKKSNRKRMNRISSLRHRQRHVDSLSTSAKATSCISSSLDRLTGDRYDDSFDYDPEDTGVVISEVREYKTRDSPTAEDSTNHSSIFSSQKDMVRGDYSPNKSTLGLELVASPSLLQQVLTPDNQKSMTDLPPCGGASVGGSTLSSKSSFRREMECKKSFDRCVDVDVNDADREQQQEEDDEQEEDDIFDDESAYSAMPTVAETVVSFKSRNCIKESTSQVSPPPPSTSRPLTLHPTYSMRSVKSSEGMEVGQYFHSNFDDEESTAEVSAQQPFDETDAKIIATSKAAAVATTAAAASQVKHPASCLRPSSFAISGPKHLVSPALVQNGRMNRSSIKFRGHFDKRSAVATADTLQERSITVTQVEQKRGTDEESHPCFSAPVVSFAEQLEESHPNDEIKRNETVTVQTTANDKSSGHESPTSVSEFFPEGGVVDSHPEENNVNSSSQCSGERHASITNRLARNRRALKSMAQAKGSAKDARKKNVIKKSAEENENETEAVSPTEQEEKIPPIVQSVSELDIPQFHPVGGASKETGADEIKPEQKEEEKESNPPTEDEIDDENSPSIEVDASILLNTSDESTNSRKKRFLLPRLRRRAKEHTGSTPTNASKSPTNSNVSNKSSIKSKLFGGKKKEEAKMKKAQEKTAMELEAIKEVEKYTAWLAPTTQPSEEEFPLDEAPASSLEKPMQKQEEINAPEAHEPQERQDDVAAAPSHEKDASPIDAAALILDVEEPSVVAEVKPSEVAETSLIIETDVILPPTPGEDNQSSKNSKPLPFFGARARSSSSKTSKSSLTSKSSFSSKLSKSPKQASLEPTLAESPSRVRTMDTDDGAPLLGNGKRVASSSAGSQPSLNNFADFGAASIGMNDSQLAQDTSVDLKNSSFGEEMVNAQVQHMFPDFGSPHFVGGDISGETEHGVEVEWGVSVMGPNEFGDEGIALDTTAVVADFERSLSEANWDNNIKVAGDDISWPSEVVSQQEATPAKTISDEDAPLKVVDSSPSSTENKFNNIEEASTKSGGTKSSSLHPRKLFGRRSKDKRGQQKLEEEEEESVSGFKHFVAEKKRSPHPADKRDRDVKARRGKEDIRSLDEDSDDYSSDDYSSDDREDVVGVIATSLHKGFTGIVDMMENAFAFNKDEETVDYASESSESEEEDEDEDSYIQRKMARRRDKQRRRLHEARRSSRRQQQLERRRRISQSARWRINDNESVVSEEEHNRRGKIKSSRRYASSGRASSRRRVESPRYKY